MAADETYTSAIQARSLVNNNILPGTAANRGQSIKHVLGIFPEGLDEFIINFKNDPPLFWTPFGV